MFVAATQTWGESVKPPGSAVDDLLAHGKLPEPLNSAKQILDELTKERHGNKLFRTGALTFAIAQIVYKAYKDREFKAERCDDVQQFIDKHELAIPKYLRERESLGGTTWAAVRNCKIAETITFGDGDSKIRKYVVGATPAYYIGSDSQFENSSSPMPPMGPYIKLTDEEAFVSSLRSELWSTRSLQLTLGNSWYGDPVFGLSEVESAKDYVPSGSGDANLDALIERTLLFRNAGHRRRIMLHGPPGTGKSTLAHKMSERIGYGRLLHISSSSLEYLSTAMGMIKFMEPDVALIDDIDRADYRVQDFLRELENFPKRIIVFATCNTMKGMDSAILRSGRFDEIYEIGLPEASHRKSIAQHYAQKFGVKLLDSTAEIIAEKTEKLSPAAIREFFTTASTVFPECRQEHLLTFDVSGDLIEHELKRIKLQAELSNTDFQDED